MPPSSDIILIGAGRHPRTKMQRLKHKPARRNIWIGTVQIITGMRYPVDIEFVKKHFKDIVAGIKAGVLLVEYKYDTYVDPEELQTLAYGSEAERQTYEDSISQGTLARAEELRAASEEGTAQADEALRRNVFSNTPMPQADSRAGEGEATEPARGPINPDNATRFGGGLDGVAPGEERIDNDRLNNLEGSHEDPIPKTTPRELAESEVRDSSYEHVPDLPPSAAGNVALDEMKPIGQFDENSNATDASAAVASAAAPSEDEAEAELDTGEPEYQPDPNVPRSVPEGHEYKPLPDGWQKANKAELLQLCTERGIDTSDMPSNKDLRKRLSGYGH